MSRNHAETLDLMVRRGESSGMPACPGCGLPCDSTDVRLRNDAETGRVPITPSGAVRCRRLTQAFTRV